MARLREESACAAWWEREAIVTDLAAHQLLSRALGKMGEMVYT
jgi:hypothetical protein